MTPTKAHRGWRGQYAPGRVFELKRKTYRGDPVCVLGIRPEDGSWLERHFVQIDARGCTEGSYGYSRARTRFSTYALHPSKLATGLVARRRPDLERFDEADLDLIRYGIEIEFGGKLRTGDLTQAKIPHIPGKRWTIFWTKNCPGMWNSSEAGRTLDSLLQGHWHIHSNCGGDWRFGRDSNLEGWATTDTDPARLRRIERHLRQHLPHLEVQVIEMVGIADGDRTIVRAHGTPCPAISASGTSTIWADGHRGYSISCDDRF